MAVVVVTVTQVMSTVTATPTSSSGASSLPPGSVAGIIIGSIVGGVLLIAFVFYLFSRYTRRKFTRVAAHDAEGARSKKANSSACREKRPSMSKEPLMSAASWPPLPANSRVLSPATPRDIVLPSADSPSSTYDLGEVSPGHGVDSIMLAQQSLRTSSWSSLGNTSLPTPQTPGDGGMAPPPPPKPQGLFIHRTLQPRARASEDVSFAQTASLDPLQSHAAALDSLAVPAIEEVARGAEEEEEIVEEDLQSTESIYSQVSASFDHSEFFSEPISRQNSPFSLPRRTPSRKKPRSPAPPTDLYPVAEVPDTPTSPVTQTVFSAPTATDSSLGVRIPDATTSPSVSLVVDQSGAFPLLASANFGRDCTSPATPVGSVSSSVGWKSSSSGVFSRYPSLAPSSFTPSSQSLPHPDTGTDWYHPPPGLAALSSTQIGSLLQSSLPIEGQTEQQEVSPDAATQPATVRHAHLREGTRRSLPEVEMRNVMQGGIAHIDVAL